MLPPAKRLRAADDVGGISSSSSAGGTAIVPSCVSPFGTWDTTPDSVLQRFPGITGRVLQDCTAIPPCVRQLRDARLPFVSALSRKNLDCYQPQLLVVLGFGTATRNHLQRTEVHAFEHQYHFSFGASQHCPDS
jgi:hypothetical protein